jgi:glycosyltransferase involved in cell wall biosynthesis
MGTISIVTISYNNGRYLTQAVNSVLAQKTKDIEYIVVDAGSTDGSVAFLRTKAAFIDKLIIEPDRGPADGLNKGFAHATGEYGYFLNGDDVLLPDGLRILREAWKRMPRADVILGGGVLIDGEGRILRWYRGVRPRLVPFILGWEPFFQQGMSFRLEKFRSVGGFNIENRTCWDGELMADLLASGAVVGVETRPIGAFRIHGDSLTGSGDPSVKMAYQKDRRRIQTKHLGWLAPQYAGVAERVGKIMQYVLHPTLVPTRLYSAIVGGAARRITMPEAAEGVAVGEIEEHRGKA